MATSTTPFTGRWSDPDAFRNKTFHGYDFSGRCLVGTDFSGSVLKDCNFSCSDLSNANFKNADLYRCDFSQAIVYAVEFDNANLTRANFRGAFTYGILMNSPANITYADLLHFELEPRRRSVTFLSGAAAAAAGATYAIGDTLPSPRELSQGSYRVGAYKYTFADLEPEEEALQRSQIFNRLKRLYRENQNGQAALHCLYEERYHLTRSRYRLNPLAGGPNGPSAFSAVARTLFGYVSEFTAGYGVKPARILRNLALLFAAFFAVCCLSVAAAEGSPMAFAEVRCPATTSDCDVALHPVQLNPAGVVRLLEYSALSAVNPDPQRYVVSGGLAVLSLVYFLSSAVLLALLFSSVFVRLLSDG